MLQSSLLTLITRLLYYVALWSVSCSNFIFIIGEMFSDSSSCVGFWELFGFLPLFFFSRNLSLYGRALIKILITCQKLSILAPWSHHCMSMSRFVEILFSFFFVFGVFSKFLIHVYIFNMRKLIHGLFHSSLHHSEILFWVDWFCFGLILDIFHFFDWAMLALLAFNAVVNTGSRLWRFAEEMW